MELIVSDSFCRTEQRILDVTTNNRIRLPKSRKITLDLPKNCGNPVIWQENSGVIFGTEFNTKKFHLNFALKFDFKA